jgi:2-haloacid dehalogenase
MRGGMTDALLGMARPFAEHIAAALAVEVARRGLDPGRIPDAMARAAALPAWPDARAALDRLRSAGHRLAVLTNSGAAGGRATLDAAGLADRFDHVLGVDAVSSFKPHPSTYGHAVERLATDPREIMFVAAHAWDVTGAKHAGLRTLWLARGEQVLAPTALAPDLVARDLHDAAEQLTRPGGDAAP